MILENSITYDDNNYYAKILCTVDIHVLKQKISHNDYSWLSPITWKGKNKIKLFIEKPVNRQENGQLLCNVCENQLQEMRSDANCDNGLKSPDEWPLRIHTCTYMDCKLTL